MNHFITGIIDFCVELLYPKRCVTCDKVLLKKEKEQGFCRTCAGKVRLIGSVYCLKCGMPMKRNDELCDNCKSTSHQFLQNKAIFRYSGDMKNAMYRFKYSNKRCYGKVFAKHAMMNYGHWLKAQKFDAIVPVPMYKKKMKIRGYNQAEVFAKELSKVINVPVANGIIRREIDTMAMKRLNRLKRKKNLLNAFIMTENEVQFRKVLIVDDIYTTGTTLDEVAGALKLGGIREIYGLCVCIGEVQ